MLVWQSAEEVEELESAYKKPLALRPWAAKKELSGVRQDTLLGMAASQLIQYFIIVAAGAAIFPTGVRTIESAEQAALALRSVGGMGATLFAVGLIGTGILAIPTLTCSSAYAIAAAAGWRGGLNRPPGRVKAFNAVIVVGTLIAGG